MRLGTARESLGGAARLIDEMLPLAESAMQGREVLVDVARYTLDLARIRAPSAGVVLSVATNGQVLMAGAPAATLRQDGDLLVDTYLTPAQLLGVTTGTSVELASDSLTERMRGTVVAIAEEQVFPPASFPSEVPVLGRVVKVTIRLRSGPSPAFGTPVDVRIAKE